MRMKQLLSPLLLAGFLISCGEGVGPDAATDDVLLNSTLNLVKWSKDGTPTFSAEGDVGTAGTLGGDSPLLSLSGGDGGTYTDDYQVTFWAVSGEHRYVQLNYTNDDGLEVPFMRLDVYEPLELADGSEIGVGDSVAIRVYAKLNQMEVRLEPHGLRFGRKKLSTLQMWYTGANGDLNDDGVVDDYDQQIEYNMLGLWYQATSDDPWTILNAEQDFAADLITGDLEHFSGYAVAW